VNVDDILSQVEAAAAIVAAGSLELSPPQL
jgi:hypothetical protein